VLLVCAAVFVLLIWNGVILLNNPSDDDYPVRGIDVSHYQGEIDWQTLSSQELSFTFIKATEGSSYVDECFAYNFAEAQKCGIAVGAYHFFSFDSPGETQAENFIGHVAPFEGMLPPVIDLEFYGDNVKNPPDRELVSVELEALIDALEAYYRLKPIIYTTEKAYEIYLSGEYDEYDIWIRDVVAKPKLSDGREWTFWQYTNRETLDGYKGEEKYIDVNVFNGSEVEFEKYPKYSFNNFSIKGET
ncbi:MAG: glycoside hydrolase family 25 protein, partial [Clostridia bacterium]|nr:glycoside hydrolase family 25 protein [Clostridia bacterium]